MNDYTLHLGDCLQVLPNVPDESADLIYVDPPFLTQKIHSLTTRDGKQRYSFRDLWASAGQYGDFILSRLRQCRRCLKQSGSLFFHCDDNSSHIARLLLDEVFGPDGFQSEIIWVYRRWSNSRKGLVRGHQTIWFYSQSESFKFNQLMTNYSETTNLDQILQRRVRDDRGKAVYARTDAGDLILNGAKKGVPLGDVWDIPYLNPKARERVGYPTQKPVLLLERIIGLCTDPNDVVLDPFCGSGTTLVAAILLGRIAIGIDTSEEALSLTRRRLEAPERTTSRVLEIGRDEYARKDIELLENLRGLPFHAVHRNRGIDAILSADWHGKPVCVRIQRPHETIEDAASALCRATECKGDTKLIVVVVDGASRGLLGLDTIPEHVLLIPSAAESIRIALEKEGHQSGLDAPSTATDRCALGLTSAPLRA